MVEVIEADVKGGIMGLCESETIELKEMYTPDLKKEVAAFANPKGGTKIFWGSGQWRNNGS